MIHLISTFLPYTVPGYGLDWIFVAAARQSTVAPTKKLADYLRNPEKDAKLLSYLIEHGHFSPFEMVQLHFQIQCPIFVARQWMRHRTWSYNEASLRYQEFDKEKFSYHIPSELRKQSSTNKQSSSEVHDESHVWCRRIDMNTEACIDLYETMIERGISREQARMVLPVNINTCFMASVNYRNLWNFLWQRDHPDAQAEIREYAEAIKMKIAPYFPLTFDLMEKRCPLPKNP